MKTYKAHAFHFLNTPLWMAELTNLGLAAKCVYGLLNYLDRKHEKVHPSQELMAEMLGVSRPTIIKAIGELVDSGYLRVFKPVGVEKSQHFCDSYEFVRVPEMDRLLEFGVPSDVKNLDTPCKETMRPPAQRNYAPPCAKKPCALYKRKILREKVCMERPVASTPHGQPKRGLKEHLEKMGIPKTPEEKLKTDHKAQGGSIAEWERAYRQAWSTRNGEDSRCPFQPGRDRAILKQIQPLLPRGLCQFQEILKVYFEDDKPFFKGHGLATLKHSIAEFLETPKQAPQQAPGQAPLDEFAMPEPLEVVATTVGPPIHGNALTAAEERYDEWNPLARLYHGRKIVDEGKRERYLAQVENQQAQMLLEIAKLRRQGLKGHREQWEAAGFKWPARLSSGKKAGLSGCGIDKLYTD